MNNANLKKIICVFLCVVSGMRAVNNPLTSVSSKATNMAPKIEPVKLEDHNAGDDGYYSDSEDEDGYQYRGLDHLTIPDAVGKQCMLFSRGIHYSPSKFDRGQISRMRRRDYVGKAIFAAAAYALARKKLDDEDGLDTVARKAAEIKALISSFSPEERDMFQQYYSNGYISFHKKLGTADCSGIFSQFHSKDNPQVSTSEDFLHPGKYSAGDRKSVV